MEAISKQLELLNNKINNFEQILSNMNLNPTTAPTPLMRIPTTDDRPSAHCPPLPAPATYAAALARGRDEWQYRPGKSITFHRGGTRNMGRDRFGGGPEQNFPPSHQRPQGDNTGRGPENTVKSNNPDFALMTKRIYNFIQIRRAESMWTDIPSAVNNKLDEIFQGIKPPLGDERLYTSLANLNTNVKSDMLIQIQGHLSAKSLEVKQVLKTLNPEDKHRAAGLAKVYMRRSFGRKISPAQAYEWVGEALALVGAEHNPDRGPTESRGDGGMVAGPRGGTAERTGATGSGGRGRMEGVTDGPGTCVGSDGREDGLGMDEGQTAAPVGSEGEDEYGGWHPAPRHKKRRVAPTPPPTRPVSQLDPTRSPPADPRTPTLNQTQPDPVSTPPSPTRIPVPNPKPPSPKSPNPGPSPKPNLNRKFSLPLHTVINKPVIHQGPKADWNIGPLRPGTTHLVISDSNMRHVTDIPPNWAVHVFPGARFNHAADIVKSLPAANRLENLILSVGINNRNWATNSVTPDFNKLVLAAERTKVPTHFVGISCPPQIPDKEKSGIYNINKMALKKFSTSRFIQPTTKVSVDPSDQYLIHYDQGTLNTIFSNIKNHFLLKGKGGNFFGVPNPS